MPQANDTENQKQLDEINDMLQEYDKGEFDDVQQHAHVDEAGFRSFAVD